MCAAVFALTIHFVEDLRGKGTHNARSDRFVRKLARGVPAAPCLGKGASYFVHPGRNESTAEITEDRSARRRQFPRCTSSPPEHPTWAKVSKIPMTYLLQENDVRVSSHQNVGYDAYALLNKTNGWCRYNVVIAPPQV